MKYAVLFEDNDEFAHMRPQFMADHLQFLGDNSDKINAAGPLKDATTQDPAGGLWIVEADKTQPGRYRLWSRLTLSGQPVCENRSRSWNGPRFMSMAAK